MKILFITHYFAPDSGAAANRLTRLARMLQSRGHEVTVLTTMPHYPTGKIPEAYRRRLYKTDCLDGVKVLHIWLWTSSSKKTVLRLISQLSFMLMLMLRGLFVRQPDVIFIENQPVFTGFAGWFISKVKRTPYVLNISDYWPEYLLIAGLATEKSLSYRIFKALTVRTQQDAAHLAVMWEGLRDGVIKRLSHPPPVTLIHNAADLETFHPQVDDSAFREKYQLGDQRIVSFLGVLGAHIDLETMLSVAKKLGTEDDVLVLFVGSGTQLPDLQNALRNTADYPHCRLIDWLDYSEVPEFWAASTISYWAMHDNPLDKLRFQAKLFEAFASGTPAVIAIAEGLMSQLLRDADAGLTVAPYDADALYTMIKSLLDNPQRYAELSRNARAYAETHFDQQAVVDAYENLLQQAAR